MVAVGLLSANLAHAAPGQVSDDPAAWTPPSGLPTLNEVLDADRDLWGELAMQGEREPDYAFFADLLPPLRYVDAVFRHYPIVLSPPGGAVKARLVSNGSAVNAKAGLRSWKDTGYPVTFHVGDRAERFGGNLRKLEGPRYLDGCLPVVQNRYRHLGATYAQECFAAVDPPFAERGTVFVKFTLLDGPPGSVDARLRVWGPLNRRPHRVTDDDGNLYLWLGSNWRRIEIPQRRHLADLKPGDAAVLAVVSDPAPLDVDEALSIEVYTRQRERCIERWTTLLDRSVKVDVPEERVNRAWRSLIVGTFVCAKGDVLNYSASNAYERQYVAECGDAVRALLLYGFVDEARRMIPPLFDHVETIAKKKIDLHNAGFGLQLLAHYYWLTKDTDLLREQRDRWQRSADLIVQSREPSTGLMPRENYAGDIFDQVYSLNTNSNCWRGLRDLAVVLADAGMKTEAEPLAETARALRKSVLDALARSERLDTSPPFIPNALLGEEQPHRPITGSVTGSYWNLIIPYVLHSGIFPPDSPRADCIIDYLHEHGGVCMGMTRIDLHSGDFAGDQGLDDLYGLRYVLTLLERDEVERALVTFYGKLAQGLTRDTFIGAECTGLVPLNEFGRPMGLPPNSASNAMFLWLLRYMLVQDMDGDGDGIPETLRLFPATPRAWLLDGKTIAVREAPTAFGPVAAQAESRIAEGQVRVHVQMPPRPPNQVLLRTRLPAGFRVTHATLEGTTMAADTRGTVDLTPWCRQDEVSVVVHVSRGDP